MMKWFVETAPIRQKMTVVALVATGLVALAGAGAIALTLVAGPLAALLLCGALAAATWVAGTMFRTGVVDPYVATVVRMEGLAAGDLAAPIAFTHHLDCVGRMTKAMFTFRDTAVAQQQAAAEQRLVVDALSRHLEHLSRGDLTQPIASEFPGDYAALKGNFNAALASLRELIGAVGSGTEAIRTGSEEIASASENLSRRTEANAASLEETAAAITQMDQRLRTSAEAATRTVERADQAIATVGGGRAVADEAVQAMGRVSESAKGIDSVIEGLDKIAFQTRVLAMNAAVEAGRAGEAGRGFAVVADLVSALAMRAEEEAKRARDQLTVTQTEIVTAVEAVTRVDHTFADISGDVGQVHQLLATMASDNQAQAAAITEISSAVGTMDQATQQNAAMVEETSAAARNLAVEVSGLAEQAARFKVEGARATPPARRPATPAYASPVKPLPSAAIPALVRQADDWNAF